MTLPKSASSTLPIATFVAYIVERKASKNPENFRKGAKEGLVGLKPPTTLLYLVRSFRY